MYWFKEEFFYDERTLMDNYSKVVKVVDEKYNIFEILDHKTTQSYYAGRFDCLSLTDLTNMLESLQKGTIHLKLEEFCYSTSNEKEMISPEIKNSPHNKESMEIELNTKANDEKSPKEKKKPDTKNEGIEEFKKPEVKEESNFPSIVKNNDSNQIEISKGLRFFHKPNTPVKSLICAPINNEAVFQVASQFNCLEMVGPKVTPNEGITKYYLDGTQGPECALSCRSALFFRNYLFKDKDNNIGQLKKQINLLEEVDSYLQNKTNHYWKMSNGYCLIDDPKSMDDLNSDLAKNYDQFEEVKKRVKVGINWDTEVNLIKYNKTTDIPKKQRICQVFCSTLALAYDTKKKVLKTERSQNSFCNLILEAVYDATLTVAGILAHLKQKRIRVYLTAVGGGVFGNSKKMIKNAIQKSIDKHKNVPLDVILVSYSSVPEVFNQIIPPNKQR